MSQQDQGNRKSMAGMAKGAGSGEKKTVAEDLSVGSSDKNGVRWSVPNHPDKSVMTPNG